MIIGIVELFFYFVFILFIQIVTLYVLVELRNDLKEDFKKMTILEKIVFRLAELVGLLIFLRVTLLGIIYANYILSYFKYFTFLH